MENYNKEKLRILIVDDILKNIQVVGKILRSKGFLVSVARSGIEALSIMEKTLPDLILLDIIMPEMDGYETLKNIKINEKFRNIPVIFLSALSETKNKVKGFKLGAVDYITKPIESEELLSRIDLHLTVKSLQENLEEKVRLRTEELLTANDLLKKSEEEYRSLMKAVPDPIIVYNLDGLTVYLNPAFTRVFGWNLEEMANLRENFVAEGEWDRTKEAIDKILNEGYMEGFESKRKTKEGKVLDVSISGAAHRNSDGEVIGMVVNLRDITELKKTQKNIIESEKRYRLLADNANDCIWILRLSDMRLTYCSPSVEKMLGYTSEEMTELDLKKYITYESLEKVYRTINSELMRENDTSVPIDRDRYSVVELEQIKKDRTIIWVEVTASFLRNKFDQPESILGITREITDRKNLEKQLMHSQKMEAIGTLAGGIAHDFNNILSAVFGFSQLVKMKLNKDDEIVKLVDQIITAGIRAKDLVSHILTFSRQTDVRKCKVDLTPLIKESIKFVKATIPKNIEIKSQIRTKSNLVSADPSHIQQIAMNLLTNAVQAIKRNTKGAIEVTLEKTEITNPMTVLNNLKPGNYIKLTVKDNGCGIEKSNLERIFEPFFTTKSKGGGTGLGLSTIYGIVNDLNGTILVSSEPEKGTLFEVFIPEYTGDSSEEDLFSIKEIHGGKGRILIVDDEELVVKWCTELLNAVGYKVVGKKSSLEALEEFKENHKLFDLVITDLVMPEMTGLELSKKIAEIKPDVKIVLSTGSTDGLSEIELNKYCISSVVVKPMVASEFVDIINKVIAN